MGIISFLGLSGCFRCDRTSYNTKSCHQKLGLTPKQSFLRLLRNREFKKIENTLCDSERYDIGSWLDEATETSKGTSLNATCTNVRLQMNLEDFSSSINSLHLLVRYRPPLSTVDILCKWLRAHKKHMMSVEAVDKNGQTPLHVAVSRGCHVSVIERLAFASSSLCASSTMDVMKRCPLHWACCMEIPFSSPDSSSSGFRRVRTPSIEFRENMIAVVCLLLQAYPRAALMPDINDKTPLDLAYENRLDKRILLALFRAAENVHCKSAKSTEVMSMTSLDDDLSSIYSVPRIICEKISDETDGMSDSLSSIGDCGASTYRPDVIQHENRNLVPF
jgi:hypothetical protein